MGWSLGSFSSVFFSMKRQDTEEQGRVISPKTLNTLSWLLLFKDDISWTVINQDHLYKNWIPEQLVTKKKIEICLSFCILEVCLLIVTSIFLYSFGSDIASYNHT